MPTSYFYLPRIYLSGLDARAALLVVNALKEMADQGRTIVATIHQPSSTVFDMFDDLLLLKKGGEVVYHGELGGSSASLISYFEGLGAAPISLGENPSTWMLNQLNKFLVCNRRMPGTNLLLLRLKIPFNPQNNLSQIKSG